MIWYDAVIGLVLGIAISLVFFVIEYAGVTGVERAGTLRQFRSNVDRTEDEAAMLDAAGDAVEARGGGLQASTCDASMDTSGPARNPSLLDPW